MSILPAPRNAPRPSSASRAHATTHAGNPLDFIRASSRTSHKEPTERKFGGKPCNQEKSTDRKCGKKIDPCVLAALASRPHSSAASRPRSAGRLSGRPENTYDWINYELPNGQQPADYADVTRIEYTGDALHTMWRASFAVGGLVQKDGDAAFFHRMNEAIVSAFSQVFYRGSEVASPTIQVGHISRTKSASSEDGCSCEFVASVGIVFPRAAELKVTAEESVLGTVSGPTFEDDLIAHLTRSVNDLFIVEDGGENEASTEIMFNGMDLEHPSEIALRGGHGEPIVVESLPEHGRAVRAGISEGFELLWYEWFDTASNSRRKCTDFSRVAPSEIFAKGKVELPIAIAFRSPLTRLPNLSERQLAEQIGLRRVREYHFRRLVIELKHTWKKLEVQSKVDCLRLHKACGEDLVLQAEVTIGTSQSARRLPEGSVLRAADDEKLLHWKDFPNLRTPAFLRVGRPIEEAQPNVTAQQFRKALRRAGIVWLSLEQEDDLLSHLEPEQEEIDRYGDTAWEMSLAERFVMDTEGRFVHIGRAIRASQILGVTKALQRRLAARSSQDGFDGTLSFSEFHSALTTGGIIWLKREQVKAIFNSMTSGDIGISLGDWLSRFQWEPIKAVTEVQRALEPRKPRGLSAGRRRAMPKPKSRLDLNFSAFQSRLFDLGISWLTVEQQRIIFDTIDVDKSGTITEEELAKVAEVREELEAEREAALAKEIEERSAAKAERAAQIAARVKAAEAERQAEVERAKAEFDEKMRGKLRSSPTRGSIDTSGYLESGDINISEIGVAQEIEPVIADNSQVLTVASRPDEEVTSRPIVGKDKMKHLSKKLGNTFANVDTSRLIELLKECKVSTEGGGNADIVSTADVNAKGNDSGDVVSAKRKFGEKLKQHAEEGTLLKALEQVVESSTNQEEHAAVCLETADMKGFSDHETPVLASAESEMQGEANHCPVGETRDTSHVTIPQESTQTMHTREDDSRPKVEPNTQNLSLDETSVHHAARGDDVVQATMLADDARPKDGSGHIEPNTQNLHLDEKSAHHAVDDVQGNDVQGKDVQGDDLQVVAASVQGDDVVQATTLEQ